MRFPPRQSTGEADLMVPFQLVSLYNIRVFMIIGSDQVKIVYITLSFGNAQAATKTIGEEDKYFSRVSLRSVTSSS